MIKLKKLGRSVWVSCLYQIQSSVKRAQTGGRKGRTIFPSAHIRNKAEVETELDPGSCKRNKAHFLLGSQRRYNNLSVVGIWLRESFPSSEWWEHKLTLFCNIIFEVIYHSNDKKLIHHPVKYAPFPLSLLLQLNWFTGFLSLHSQIYLLPRALLLSQQLYHLWLTLFFLSS